MEPFVEPGGRISNQTKPVRFPQTIASVCRQYSRRSSPCHFLWTCTSQSTCAIMRVTTTMHNAVRTVSSHVIAMAMIPIMPPNTLIPAIPSKFPCTSARQPVHSDGHSFLDIRIPPN